jgi:methyl-accepting chemotaxis protein
LAVEKARSEADETMRRRQAEADRQAQAARAETEAQAQAAAERTRTAEEQARAFRALGVALGKLANGDFTFRLSADIPDAYRQIKDDFNGAIGRLRETIHAVADSTHEVAKAASEIATASSDLSERVEQQAASLEQTSTSMAKISATVKTNAESAQQANELTNSTQGVADRGGKVVAEAVTAMSRIEESSRQISDIIGVIDEIARQTNFLALNAAVEAARAGDAGRGFAVVASEVRNLAQRSSEAAKNIKDLIATSSDRVAEGVGLVNRAGTRSATSSSRSSAWPISLRQSPMPAPSSRAASNKSTLRSTRWTMPRSGTRRWSKKIRPPPRRWSSSPMPCRSAFRASGWMATKRAWPALPGRLRPRSAAARICCHIGVSRRHDPLPQDRPAR